MHNKKNQQNPQVTGIIWFKGEKIPAVFWKVTIFSTKPYGEKTWWRMSTVIGYVMGWIVTKRIRFGGNSFQSRTHRQREENGMDERERRVRVRGERNIYLTRERRLSRGGERERERDAESGLYVLHIVGFSFPYGYMSYSITKVLYIGSHVTITVTCYCSNVIGFVI